MNMIDRFVGGECLPGKVKFAPFSAPLKQDAKGRIHCRIDQRFMVILVLDDAVKSGTIAGACHSAHEAAMTIN